MDCAVTSSENCLGTKSDSTLRKTADWILHKTCPTANDDESVSVAAKNITSDSQSKLLNDDEDWSDDIQF
jgi:hypothetical protein